MYVRLCGVYVLTGGGFSGVFFFLGGGGGVVFFVLFSFSHRGKGLIVDVDHSLFFFFHYYIYFFQKKKLENLVVPTHGPPSISCGKTAREGEMITLHPPPPHCGFGLRSVLC